MILVDTTVLVYAVGGDHPLREPCRMLVRAIGNGSLVACTTVEVIQEFAHVRARRRGREDACDLADRYARLFAPLLTVDAEDLTAGLQLYRATDRIGAFDAVLASVAMRRSAVTALVSADGGYSAVPGLKHVDPADVTALADLGL